MKTLKDIPLENEYGGCRECGLSEICIKDKLRQEAIKWIKELESPIFQYLHCAETYWEVMKFKEKTGCMPEWIVKNSNQILWIKHFFNITEEELK